ncbi:MAG: hypothetical protein ACJ746_23890 [Bryobacteraceae bacterium]
MLYIFRRHSAACKKGYSASHRGTEGHDAYVDIAVVEAATNVVSFGTVNSQP